MKVTQIIGYFIALTALAACGGSNSVSSESNSSSASTTTARQNPASLKAEGSPTPPRVVVPKSPPPKKIIVRDPKEGHGARIKAGQQFTANMVSVNYRTGKPFETSWGRSAFRWRFGRGEMVKGLEIGFKGMRVGGRRELIVPARLAYGRDAVVYLIELLAVE